MILYEDFLNPMDTYDSLIIDLMNSGFVDSLKIIGRPIHEDYLNIKIDTLRVLEFGLSPEVVKNEIIKIDSIESIIDISNYKVTNEFGDKIPISAFSELNLESNYYKPEIFIPEPAVFYYNNSKVVKVELYCKKKNEKELTKIILIKIHDYSYNFMNEDWMVEIIKSKKHYDK